MFKKTFPTPSPVRRLTSLGAVAALVATLLGTGCGQSSRGLAGPARVEAAARPGYAVRFQARPPVRSLRAPLPGTAARGLEEEPSGGEPGAAPAPQPIAPPTAGGLRPLPRPTPTAPPQPPAPPPEPDEVDALLVLLQNFGYNGTRARMIKDLQACLFAYPINAPGSPGGWDRRIDPREHYAWWKKTLPPDETATFNDYMQQSLLIAQNKFDVVYYVWISKQYNPGQAKREHRTSPFVDLNEQLPVVKGIAGGGWMVQIAPNGTIHDYLKIPTQYLRDYNHLLRIPESLYF
ncbi:MAG: hypothetical protein VKQ33_05885 [Candidatus Sericytochromatia bacterium]|nr:hypothetical protein [Candidatus Sericytochromatia bacterium]